MSDIRPLTTADIPAVAGLFQRIFRHSDQAAPPALVDYLRHLYLEAPGYDPEVAPLVHVNDGGRISGFVGVNALPMSYKDRQLRAAICGALMVEGRESDPMAGARLLKAFLAGPQDLSFSETASETSTQMWTRLRGIVLPQYSLDWVRVLRPASFAVELLSGRIGPVRALRPLARAFDERFRGKMARGDLRWSAVPKEASVPAMFQVADIDAGSFAELFAPLIGHFAVQPAWTEGQFNHILRNATEKPDFGAPHFAAVKTRTGAPVGAFFYHMKPGGTARVLQLLAMPGQAGPVLDCLIDHAAARGAAALRGRTQPALLEAMMGRRIGFVHAASTVVHSRDEELVDAFRHAQGFVNGLAGEHWSRLIGGSFDGS
ncbi:MULTISPECIES: hypothetical protein [Sinorhizobium]|uniref:N-acetyltransferase domain-containing protein n=1 Tax=Rhizobium fredii TaxID=380 RepID=A0A2L0HE73_RHIFR|nr:MULTISPECIES: hypothetical protein [Sinorhizobium]AUX79790.1 hypothetical protein NXT3_PC00629 [Sinorhizobium fredii]PDT53332.1 hypothetical protein CO664_13575 [Sinorhizobium sp. NG07B]POH29491.1 hypothetical protein ATY30_18005 [Sinorhizobium americanum]